ncbi:envelope stress response membrane protein PspB [Sphingomonas sp. BIUV-7]|uniref:Envelope stress response membrane protein PspB n=1 Tax=Sphingomonas natans TaxID=3063330 RepID=A0ABT8YC51_9SPHN|nr:envelope stress response membrane protein PspB [Sphingomonas sp. BIUV-7]MDO6415898.1 envelope stress response membrane protein PspB [Sphingomonas sp. BIUV-7]
MHDLIPLAAILSLFVGLPWLIFHYVTQWRKSGSLSIQDENLLDELHDLARRLDDRLATIERIVAADNPAFRRPETERLADDAQDDHVFDRIAERRRQR